MSLQVNVAKLNTLATFDKQTNFDVGFDLTCVSHEYSGHTDLYYLNLGVKVETSRHYFFTLVPRSSFPKTGFIMANSIGIIDPEYRGEWKMLVRDMSLSPFHTKATYHRLNELIGTRVAQAIPNLHIWTPVATVDVEENIYARINYVEESDLRETTRGEGGFGSTGQT